MRRYVVCVGMYENEGMYSIPQFSDHVLQTHSWLLVKVRVHPYKEREKVCVFVCVCVCAYVSSWGNENVECFQIPLQDLPGPKADASKFFLFKCTHTLLTHRHTS